VRRLPPLALALLALACGGGGGGGSPGGSAGAACASAGDCQAGLVCFARACVASYAPSPACAPGGTPRLVLGDAVELPEPPAGTCLTAPREPAPPDGFVDLGVRTVGAQGAVEVPPGTSSLTIFSQEVDGSAVDEIGYGGVRLPNTVVPTDVRLPGGAPFFSDADPYPVDAEGYDDVTGVLAYYAGLTPVSGTFTLPNTAAGLDLVRTAGEVPTGTWTFTVNDWALECLGVQGCTGGDAGGRYRVHALARPGPFASTGTLDLEVYLATDPQGPLATAAGAVDDPLIARWVRALSSYLANAGICLGTVTLRDLPAWAKARYAPAGVVDVSGGGLGLPPGETAPGCDDLSQLFTAGVAPGRAVHLFLAEELVDPGSAGIGTTLGVDGSIPGPSGLPGTIHGGAVVGLFDFLGFDLAEGACASPGVPSLACGTDVLAYVAAHEAGHWLGLYHTTEWPGTTFDPLSDTPTCPCRRCAPLADRGRCAETGAQDPTPIEAASCDAPEGEPTGGFGSGAADCGGASNLMFWQFDPERAGGRLSPQQGEVMRLNPAVR
jgi:hypothetical protein